MSYLGLENTFYTEYFAPNLLTKSKHESKETWKLRGLINVYLSYRRFTLRDLVELMLRNGHLKDPISETHVIKSLANSLASMKGLERVRVKKRRHTPIPALVKFSPLWPEQAPPSRGLSVAVAAATAVVLALLVTWAASLWQ